MLRPQGSLLTPPHVHHPRPSHARLASIPGSSVEHNTFCVSAHFRNCEGELWQEVVQAVEQVRARGAGCRRREQGLSSWVCWRGLLGWEEGGVGLRDGAAGGHFRGGQAAQAAQLHACPNAHVPATHMACRRWCRIIQSCASHGGARWWRSGPR